MDDLVVAGYLWTLTPGHWRVRDWILDDELLGDVREGSRLHDLFSATSSATTHPQLFLLGSSGYSAQLAGILGLAFVQAHHFDMGGTDESLRLYRERFEPVGNLKEPYAIVSANVVVAETEEE